MKECQYLHRRSMTSDRSAKSAESWAMALDTIATVLPMEWRDELAELLSDQDVETLRHLVNQGIGENPLRALGRYRSDA